MFECKIPTFNPAPLRREILESLRDLAMKEQAARYDSYSDGILSGCGLFEEGMRIGVTAGLVKFAGRIYILPARDSVPYQPTDAWTVLKIQFGGEEKSRDFIRYSGNLFLDNNLNILPNEIELGRFKLKQGSRLRTDYEDFQDMETEYDTVNPFYVPFAGVGEHTLSPVVLSHFAREAFAFASDPLDIAFCVSCLSSSGVMSRESIRLYLWVRLGLEGERFDNRALHLHLAQILSDMKGQSRPGGSGRTEGLLLL